MSHTPADIRKIPHDQLTQQLRSWGQPAFRSDQIRAWIWQKGMTNFDNMTNLPLALRQQLAANFVFKPPTTDLVQRASDGTIKIRLQLHDGHKVESVLIPVPADGRYTVCVSSQVGCSLTCAFCATGRMGRLRNLEAAEIVDQVRIINDICLDTYKQPITNIVFMGMGEPLLTYVEVMRSIDIITAPWGLQMSPRRITISTAGIAKAIRRLADDGTKVNLALSLHAADDDKRNTIMPINETNNLTVLMDALAYFYQKTGNRISYEYIAFESFNDTPQDARRLAQLCKRFPVRVNIIEYNAIDGAPFQKSSEDRLTAFAGLLADQGITVTVRRSRGRDIDAACGQLANK